MDISLNITSAPQPLRSKPEIQLTTQQRAQPKVPRKHANGFMFNFGEGEQKVKAIVARKRSIAVKKTINATIDNDNGVNKHKASVNTKTPDSPKNSIAFKRKASAVQTSERSNPSDNVTATQAPKNSVALTGKTPAVETSEKSQTSENVTATLSPKKSSAIKRKAPDLEASDALPSKLSINTDDNLTLNIISKPISDGNSITKPKKEKRKLNRFERQRLKREELLRAPQNRSFNENELKEGLRRFTENPNKQPRVADIFEAEERRKREESKAKALGEERQLLDEDDKPESNEPPVEDEFDYGEINPNARKTNAFRVKRAEESTVKAIDLFRDNPEARELGQRFVKPIPERLFDGTKFETLPLHPHAIKNLEDVLGYTELTTVQRKAIPKVLEDKDVLVRAQTGSGKTLAYALPIVEKIQAIKPLANRQSGILAVIIVPTRELVIQTYEFFVKLLKPFMRIVPGMLTGGEKRKAEKARLRKGINILIGTPGRLVDHLLHTATLKLDKIKFLVLDEADRLLELGYERDVQQIVEAISKHREESNVPSDSKIQRLLLSATLTPAVQKLAGLTLRDPVYIDNSEEDPSQVIRNSNGMQSVTSEMLEEEMETGILTIPDNLELNFVVVPPKLRLVVLSGLLAKEFIGKAKLKAIVFMSTMEMVNYHYDLLNESLTQKILDEDDEEIAKEQESDDDDEPLLKGLRFFKLQGNMTQTERQGVFKSFRECKSGVLVATDVVGRGIDVPEVDLVIQYSPPQFIADFVHRVGRTARAGRKGRAIIFLAPSESQFVRHLEEKRIRLSQVDMDRFLKVLKRTDDKSHTVQEAASHLQHKFQELVADDREMHTKACKAFVSWVKFYSTFPRELKPIFNVKKAHMGHFAKSFALKDAPKSFVSKHFAPKPAPPTNRLTYTERDPEIVKQEKRTKHRFSTTVSNEVRLVKMLPNSRALTTSEFDSGLSSMKKKKTKTK